MKHVSLLIAILSLGACALGEESDPDAPCLDDEILYEDDNGESFCEIEEESDGLEASVNFGYKYVGYRLGYRTYMAENCGSSGPCRGYQSSRRYSHRNAGAKCYRLTRRYVSRSPTGGYYATSRWKDTYVIDCRR